MELGWGTSTVTHAFMRGGVSLDTLRLMVGMFRAGSYRVDVLYMSTFSCKYDLRILTALFILWTVRHRRCCLTLQGQYLGILDFDDGFKSLKMLSVNNTRRLQEIDDLKATLAKFLILAL